MDEEQDWTQPLLARTISPVRHYDTTDILRSRIAQSNPSAEEAPPSRYVENDVIPETATVGRHLGWGSAYVLIISRVIGSGIFATPGLIFQSVGSIGLSLLLWIVGAIAAWLGLTVALEYGCMLPRSGGQL
jgi:Amino acid permease